MAGCLQWSVASVMEISQPREFPLLVTLTFAQVPPHPIRRFDACTHSFWRVKVIGVGTHPSHNRRQSPLHIPD